ncbi:MAG TPA: hypothetical protein PLJ35_12245 [Anaerolineae bacterium]|nr:hypothetical protein [Anaerolineae bacterium]HOQ99583.1 hypothetical protein [Anaerolineae bacterium]HPL28777.1 hypothetical protein [Anaerolineae bacterium]
MEPASGESGIGQFQDVDRQSGSILSRWLQRSGVESRVVVDEMQRLGIDTEGIGLKTFRQWTSDGESARRVSGSTNQVRSNRLVALVRWFLRENRHRVRPIVRTAELRQLIALYRDISVKNRLQLQSMLHDLEIETREREPTLTFADDWKKRLAEWPVFSFVMDRYWCVQATTSYEMALVGYEESEAANWTWWHRLTASKSGKPKYQPDSLMRSLRGPYADSYYCQQMARFKASTQALMEQSDPRYQALIELLHQTPGFSAMWQRCATPAETAGGHSVGIPVPFFRPDGTLLWMLEVSVLVSGTDQYQMILWHPLNGDSAEYLAEIRRDADTKTDYQRSVYFIEDYADHFTPKQRLALGLHA